MPLPPLPPEDLGVMAKLLTTWCQGEHLNLTLGQQFAVVELGGAVARTLGEFGAQRGRELIDAAVCDCLALLFGAVPPS